MPYVLHPNNNELSFKFSLEIAILFFLNQAVERKGQEDQEVKATILYKVIMRLAWTTVDSVSKQTNKNS